MSRSSQRPEGIRGIDVEYLRPGLAAAHLITSRGRAAFVDTGTVSAVPHLLGALAEQGLPPEVVDYVFLTHVHLDHAGGAGALLRSLPNARAVLHPRGAPHLVDPTRLIAGSIAVYGEANYRALYGEIVPIAPERVLVTEDGQRIAFGARELEVLHTPGHALHHQAFALRDEAAVFAGDTFGVSYRELDTVRGAFIVPTTTPTQFDPLQLAASIERLLALAPRTVYLMHFGAVGEAARLGEELKEEVVQFARIARAAAAAPDRAGTIAAAMRERWLARLAGHGVDSPRECLERYLLQDLELNTQGLVAWLDRNR